MLNWKTSTKIITAVLLGGIVLGASAHNLPPISADYKLQGEVEEILLSDPDIVKANVHVHSDGRVYLDYEDKYINETAYTCHEDMKQRETEICALVAETAGVDVRDVHHFIQGEYDLKTAIRERASYLDEITEIKPFHQYDLSPQDWDYLLSRVEKGELVFAEVSEESQLYWDTYYQLERTPLSWATISSNIGEATTAQRTLALPLFNEIGSGVTTYTWYYGEEGEALCLTSFDHLHSDGIVVSYDFGETYEITDELPLLELDPEN